MDSLRAAFEGSDASTQAFADKLVRKLHWDRSFAMRAIGEYKKFLYLGAVADFAVTPPRVIDQVWHEHLLFSRGYREFCDEILGREFDHHPELLPVDDQTARFKAQYDATLALYQTEFNIEPPSAFWGTPKCSARLDARKARPRRTNSDPTAVLWSGDTPLYAQFEGSSGGSHATMPEFSGGESGGGGGGGEWGGQGADGHAGGDSTSGAGSDSGGSSDSGSGGEGSGCSSGCGGCGSGGD
jgi:hypothetical protein